MDYSKVKYESIDMNAYKKYNHVGFLKDDFRITDDEGISLFEEGILKILYTKDSFIEVMNLAKKHLEGDAPINEFIQKNPCAYTVSYVLYYVADQLGLYSVKSLFGGLCCLDNVRTNLVEKKLHRLGFCYFMKENYVAPRGSIGSTWPRNDEHKCGHIFFVTKDGESRTEFPNPNNLWDYNNGDIEVVNTTKWKIRDLGAENLNYFDYVYRPEKEIYTEGFWLPPGIYPLPRK